MEKGDDPFQEIGDIEEQQQQQQQEPKDTEDVEAPQEPKVAQDTEVQQVQSTSGTASSSSSSSTDATVESGNSTEELGPDIRNSSPPFPWADVDQNPVYPREATWREFGNFKFDIEGEIRKQYEIQNLQNREVDEAILNMIVEELPAEEVAKRIVKNRGFNPDS